MELTTLHDAIMNLPNESDCYPDFDDDWHSGFAEGHRDARHAAAELTLAKDAEVARLREALTQCTDSRLTRESIEHIARAALEPKP